MFCFVYTLSLEPGFTDLIRSILIKKITRSDLSCVFSLLTQILYLRVEMSNLLSKFCPSFAKLRSLINYIDIDIDILCA